MKILAHQWYKCYCNQKEANCFTKMALLVFAELFQLLVMTEKNG